MAAPAPLPEPFASSPFRIRDAVEAGVTAAQLRGADLHVPFRRVRARSITSVQDLAAAYAAVLAPHHVFGGRTAARLWGLPIAEQWTRAETLVIARPKGTTRGMTRGTRHIAVEGDRVTFMEVAGLPVLDPLSTALTPARELRHEGLVQVVDALLTPSQWFPALRLPRATGQPYASMAQLQAFIADRSGLAGITALRAAAADARVGVDSRFETITRLLIVEAGLPEPLVHPPVEVDGITSHPDLAYPELKIAIEYEGDGHREEQQWHVDIDRYARLEAAGWITVRVTKAHMARRGAHFVERVRAARARRE